MIRIAICITDNNEMNQLRNTVCKYAEEHSRWNISISPYPSAKMLSAAINKERFHIYLIDILLDDRNGIQLGEEIRQTDQQAIIIYMASTPTQAVKSYAVQAFYFLLKPFKAEDLSPILERACEQVERTISKNIIVKTRYGIYPLKSDSILYVKYHYHYLSYYLKSGEVIDSVSHREPFNQLVSPLLEEGCFVKVSASTVLNMNYINSVSSTGFLLRSGEQITVTRRYADARKRYLDFCTSGTPSHYI